MVACGIGVTRTVAGTASPTSLKTRRNIMDDDLEVIRTPDKIVRSSFSLNPKVIEPGPALDALIADKVLDEDVVREDGVYYLKEQLEFEREYLQVPHYSTSIAAAWEVVESFNNMVLFVVTRGVTKQEGPIEQQWTCELEQRDRSKDYWLKIVHGDTAPHAICLAALKAVGYEETK